MISTRPRRRSKRWRAPDGQMSCSGTGPRIDSWAGWVVCRAMEANALDHVALWVADRDRLADFAYEHLGMHEIERTDDFTLVGADARRGKLTLFAAEGPRDPGALVRVVLRVRDLDEALARAAGGSRGRAPAGRARDVRRRRRASASVSCRRPDTDLDYDIDHVVLRVPDPAASAERLRRRSGSSADGEPPAGRRQVDACSSAGDAEHCRAAAPEPHRAAGRLGRGAARGGASAADSTSPRCATPPTRTRSSCGAPIASSSSTSSTSPVSRSSSTTGLDLVVAGAGMAGLCRRGACRAARRARAAAREGRPRCGGSMLLSSGVIWRHRDFDEFRSECPGGDRAAAAHGLRAPRRPTSRWLESLGARPVRAGDRQPAHDRGAVRHARS